ncbi:hypothetical protein INT45_010456 [Circinella minor]|uniref:NmrA-like domain-containing protein n=1 Tax=Circinella minor TaxID=1195481 RepID=A0A8H7S1B7_9FUNG|nr:hypothetical protein INT45_010456 [Circinella minor]
MDFDTQNKTEADKERIFVVGGTGTIGGVVVQELVKRGALVTVYARSPQKVQQDKAITVIQGDYNDLTPLEQSISGHHRLFLLVGEVHNIRDTTVAISKIAYASGIQQIVEISVKRVPWRKFRIADGHLEAEKIVYDLPEKMGRSFVSLNSCNFMTNVLVYYLDAIKNEDAVVDSAEPNDLQEWTSPNDIAHVAVRILCDPIEKHEDAAYDLIGDNKTPLERAAILSNLLGRKITYKQIPVQDMYNKFIKAGYDHATSFYLASYQDVSPVTRGWPILLGGQAPETFDVWASKNKNLFL